MSREWLERGALRPEELGLTLAEAKGLLHGMQQSVVTEQIAEYVATFKTCRDCGAPRTRKGQHAIAYRKVFGKISLLSPRLYDCPCQNRGRHSASPLAALLGTHCAPELLYLETKFASLMSYGLSVDLLTEILPIAEEINPTTMQRHLQQVAERIEGELGKEQSMFIELSLHLGKATAARAASDGGSRRRLCARIGSEIDAMRLTLMRQMLQGMRTELKPDEALKQAA